LFLNIYLCTNSNGLKGKGMSSRTFLFTEMHLGHSTILVCLPKLVIASNESLWATLDIWLIPYYHSSLCLEDGSMSQIFLKSYSFEVDACTPWHRIDFSKIQLACVGSVLISKIYLILVFVTLLIHLWLQFSVFVWWLVTSGDILLKSIISLIPYLYLSLSNLLEESRIWFIWIISSSSKIGDFWIEFIYISFIQIFHGNKGSNPLMLKKCFLELPTLGRNYR
jgi:hypothetical protein